METIFMKKCKLTGIFATIKYTMINYLFVSFFKLSKKSSFWKDTPVLFACFVMGFCLLINLHSLIFIVDTIFKISIRNYIFKTNNFGVILFNIIPYSPYIYYSYKNKYLEIIDKYSDSVLIRGNAYFFTIIAYVLISFSILTITAFII